ncbi:MAG: hypothetical protein FWC15_02425 [Fibromonadales bacterium]|nr:hypothetical protein [Fibromonadales bacterium]
MKRAFLSSDLKIDLERYYPPQELFELMREKLEEKFGTMIFKKELMILETISVQGVDGYVNKVNSMKWGLGAKRGRIIIRQEEQKIKIKSRDILWWILCVITLGLAFVVYRIIEVASGILGLEGTKANRAIMRTLGEEIEKLVKG